MCRQNRRAAHINPKKAHSLLEGKDFFDSYFFAFVQETWGCTDTMVIKRKALEEAGCFTPGGQNLEDIDLWWRIAYRWPQIGYVSRPLAVYHLEVPDSLIQTANDRGVFGRTIERHLKEGDKGLLVLFHD